MSLGGTVGGFMKRIIAILLSIMIAFGSYISTEAVNTNVTDTESELNNKTTISLTKSSATVYIGATIKIEASITNGKGKTVYSSSKKKVATVTSKGKIKAIGSGKAKITISNNGVKRTFKLTVKKPKLNHKKLSLRTAKTACYNKTAKLKVIGKTGKAKVTYKSNNSKVASVNKKGKVTAKSTGKAKITVKYRGVKFSCKVTVRKVSKIEKLIKVKKIVFKQLKKTLTKNIGTPAVPLNDFFEFSVETNGSELFQKGYNVQKIWAAEEKLTKNIEEPKYSLTTSGIIKGLSDGKIVPVKQGETTLQAKCNGKTLSLPITITRVKETEFNGEKSKAVYNNQEAYKIYKDMFYNYVLKGENPKYRSMTFYYDNYNFESYLHSTAENENETGENFGYFLEFSGSELPLFYDDESFDFISNKSENDENEVWSLSSSKENLAEYSSLYTIAQEIFEEINFDSYNSVREKMFALSHWLLHHCHYDINVLSDSFRNPYSGAIALLLKGHKGVCADYALTTTYLCSLKRIPCIYISAHPAGTEGHAWNIIEYDGKWYNLDLLNSFLFSCRNMYSSLKNVKYLIWGSNLKYSDISNKNLLSNEEDNLISEALADYKHCSPPYIKKIEYTQSFWNKILGWYGEEKMSFWDAYDYLHSLDNIYDVEKDINN